MGHDIPCSGGFGVTPFYGEFDDAGTLEPLGLPYGDPLPLGEFAERFRQARDQAAKFIRHQDPFQGVLFKRVQPTFVPVRTEQSWSAWGTEAAAKGGENQGDWKGRKGKDGQHGRQDQGQGNNQKQRKGGLIGRKTW
jgi:hypothetical protein